MPTPPVRPPPSSLLFLVPRRREDPRDEVFPPRPVPAGRTAERAARRRGRSENSAGGFGYELDRWGRLERFLILGSDAPTYYASARDLTKENFAVVSECFAEDPARTADT